MLSLLDASLHRRRERPCAGSDPIACPQPPAPARFPQFGCPTRLCGALPSVVPIVHGESNRLSLRLPLATAVAAWLVVTAISVWLIWAAIHEHGFDTPGQMLVALSLGLVVAVSVTSGKIARDVRASERLLNEAVRPDAYIPHLPFERLRTAVLEGGGVIAELDADRSIIIDLRTDIDQPPRFEIFRIELRGGGADGFVLHTRTVVCDLYLASHLSLRRRWVPPRSMGAAVRRRVGGRVTSYIQHELMMPGNAPRTVRDFDWIDTLEMAAAVMIVRGHDIGCCIATYHSSLEQAAGQLLFEFGDQVEIGNSCTGQPDTHAQPDPGLDQV